MKARAVGRIFISERAQAERKVKYELFLRYISSTKILFGSVPPSKSAARCSKYYLPRPQVSKRVAKLRLLRTYAKVETMSRRRLCFTFTGA